MYTVTGVTGHVGGVVANILLKESFPVRAVIRTPDKAGEWKEKGAEIALAKFQDTGALVKAFAGASAVFVMTPPLLKSADPINDHKEILSSIVSALEITRPKHIVYLSSIGAHLANGTGAIKKLYDMEQYFTELSVPSVGIRAAWFMENFTNAVSEAKIKGTITSFLEPASLKIPMVAVGDIGKLAAELLKEKQTGHRIIELQGPCTYSANDVASVLSYRLKRPVKAEVILPHQYKDIYLSYQLTTKAAEMMSEMNTGFNSGWINFQQQHIEQRTGNTLLEDAIAGYMPNNE